MRGLETPELVCLGVSRRLDTAGCNGGHRMDEGPETRHLGSRARSGRELGLHPGPFGGTCCVHTVA